MSSFPSNIPRYIIDQNKVGHVYILVFKGHIPIQKMAHHALIVDVAGTTIESHFHGVLLHLTATAINRKTEFQFDDRLWKRSTFIVPLNNNHPYQPRKWAMDLQFPVSKKSSA